VPGVPAKNRKDYERYEADDTQNQADAVSDAVCQFFYKALVLGVTHNFPLSVPALQEI
jgi:hypothetical protein